jgi:hypothetical protein
MITARNYAAQAEKALKELLLEQTGIAHETMHLDISAVQKAQHFAIPDGALLLNTKGPGILNVKLKLPYPAITIEYYLPKEQYKMIVIAIEENDEIYCRLMLYSKSHGWLYIPVGLHIGPNDGMVKEGFKSSDSYAKGFEDSYKNISKEIVSFYRKAISIPIVEFLEALSCHNVYTEPLAVIDEKKNERRIKQGKVPLYETKILVVDTKPKEVDPNWKGGSHASPRQHLRRGHIRRYATHNIWINNTIVGKSENGKIDKSYAVK